MNLSFVRDIFVHMSQKKQRPTYSQAQAADGEEVRRWKKVTKTLKIGSGIRPENSESSKHCKGRSSSAKSLALG